MAGRTLRFLMPGLLSVLMALPVYAAELRQNPGAAADRENSAEIGQLYDKFLAETQALRQESRSKQHELDAQLYSASPDEKKIQELIKAIEELRTTLHEKHIALRRQLIKEGFENYHGGYRHKRHGRWDGGYGDGCAAMPHGMSSRRGPGGYDDCCSGGRP